MFHTFKEAEEFILSNKIVKTVALCGAHDEPALEAIIKARSAGIIRAVLIGNELQIKNILSGYGESSGNYTIIHEPDDALSAAMAVSMLKTGEADIPMKGLMQSSTYLKAILNKETGILPRGKILSEASPFEYQDENRIMIITDCAMNIEPDVKQKAGIIKNAIELARAFGKKGTIKIACLSPLEKVNSKIQSTVDADLLARMDWPEDVLVEGPLALDNAVSSEAARHKGIQSLVAGQADILLCSDLCMGNVLHKSLHFFAHAQIAGAMCGTEYPVIFTSRTDSPEAKYNSIITAVLQSLK